MFAFGRHATSPKSDLDPGCQQHGVVLPILALFEGNIKYGFLCYFAEKLMGSIHFAVLSSWFFLKITA